MTYIHIKFILKYTNKWVFILSINTFTDRPVRDKNNKHNFVPESSSS